MQAWSPCLQGHKLAKTEEHVLFNNQLARLKLASVWTHSRGHIDCTLPLDFKTGQLLRVHVDQNGGRLLESKCSQSKDSQEEAEVACED